MAYLEKSDLKTLYKTSKDEAHIWRESYPGFERLMDNGLMEGLDPNLPEVNDGSLAAALFKLPKRIFNSKQTGTIKALDRDEAWVAELANLQWQNEIIPNANTQAPFARKWKDAIRKAAGYGSVPLITLFVDRDGKRHSDFIVGQPQDVTLEPGKVSDYDSDVMFWDVYYTGLQLDNMIEQAKAEMKDAKEEQAEWKARQAQASLNGESFDEEAPEPYNKWYVKELENIRDSKASDQERSSLDSPRQQNENGDVKPKGYKFCITFQRGVNAPFYMYYPASDTTVREWSNPDPTGDIPIHFLYCYQDFINPYGIGIVKLAGGTQNVLDYMRQADVLATQLGLRPPIQVKGEAGDVDIDSMVYAQDALWFTGNVEVERMNLDNGIYQQLPDRMSMYKNSLNQIIPTGDTTIPAGTGDPNVSKTPAGVKFQAASLSIDDEDFKDNVNMTFEAVSRSMINTEFANMEGSDFMKVSDDERELLMKAGLNFEPNEAGEFSNQVEMEWDTLRAKFDFEIDAENDKVDDDAQKLDGLTKVAELFVTDPTLMADLASAGKKLNKGELYSEIIALTTDNDKILTDISPEEAAETAQQAAVDPATGQPLPVDPNTGQPVATADPTVSAGAPIDPNAAVQPQQQPEAPTEPVQDPQALTHGGLSQDDIQANVDAVMQHYGVDESTALAALAAEHQGYPIEDIMAVLKDHAAPQGAVNA